MKKLWIMLVVVALLLCGCVSQETFETMLDVLDTGEIEIAKQVTMELPKEAAVTTMESSDGAVLYLCDGYTLFVQTLAGGDLDRTMKQVTGYPKDRLTVLETKTGGTKKYSCVWAAAGEGGDQVGRAVILDDGNYHYCVSVMSDSEISGELTPVWQALMSSVSLSTD